MSKNDETGKSVAGLERAFEAETVNWGQGVLSQMRV